MKTTTAARRKRSPEVDQPAIVNVPSVEVREPVFDPAWDRMGEDQPTAENFENGEAIDPLNAQDIIQENSPASMGQKQGSFEVGDRVYYAASPDRFMEVIELCENDRLKVLRWDGAEVYADASLVKKWEYKPVAGDRVRILKAPRNVGTLATVKEVDGLAISVLPDGGMYDMLLPAAALEFVSAGVVELAEIESEVETEGVETTTAQDQNEESQTPDVETVLRAHSDEAIAPESITRPFYFYPDFLTSEQADRLLSQSEALEWQNNTIRMYGKRIPLPRLEAMYGDAGCSYTYSNSVLLEPLPWVEPLSKLRDQVQQVTGSSYQVVIGNQYRDGSDHIGWHSDDSPEMGESPAIASISLGATRHFKIRHKVTKETHEFDLTHGSLLVMHPGCQTDWQHCITKTSKEVGMRINWTFRPHLNGLAEMPIAPSEKSDSLSDISPVDAEILTLTESDRCIEALYQELQQAEGEASSAFNHVTKKYFELGIELLKRRPEFPRGTWLKWLAERGIDERYAQRAMQIGKHFAELPDSLSGMSIEGALRQIQKRLPSVEGYTLEEVKAEYDAIAPNSFKFHRGGEHPYSFEVSGFTACFGSLEQAMKRLPVLREKYGRIAEYQSVDEPEPAPEKKAIAQSEVLQVAESGWIQTKDGMNFNPLSHKVVPDELVKDVLSAPTRPADPHARKPAVAEKKIRGTDAQTLKDLCDFHGLREVAIEVLLSATVDQLSS